jgi:hypothetical protein
MHAGRVADLMGTGVNMGRALDIPLLLSTLLAAVPGALALGGALVGYGRLQGELRGVHSRMDTMDEKVTKLEGMQTDIARMDERTKSTDANVRAINDKMDTVTEHLLSEARSFAIQTMREKRP